MPRTPSPAGQSPLSARIRHIQKELGVHADGVLGPETLSAIERGLGIDPANATHLECSRSSLAQIVAFEVSSKAYYLRRLQHPVWPGGRSGVTIGIGYDLGVTDREQIQADWGGRVPDVDLAALLAVQGITGEPARTLATGLSHVTVSFEVAEAVFYQLTLPRYARLTRATYPGVQKLPPDAQGMLLSLIYNRGASLTGASRREMAEIRALLQKAKPDLQAIAAQFRAMTRLWPDSAGLRARREHEAGIIESAERAHGADELVRL